LLLGEPGPKGDPLTHPRLSLQVEAHAIHCSGALNFAVRVTDVCSNYKPSGR